MASSDRLHARRPWALLLLSALVFLALDNGIFRSGLYTKMMSTKSVAGHFAAVARWRLGNNPPDKRQILVLGHSKIEAALSEKLFDEQAPGSDLMMQMAASGGTTEKMWFYLLDHIDPKHDRFAAIVVPFDTYKTPPLMTDAENRIDDAQFLAPMLDARGWVDLVGTYTDDKMRARVMLGGLASSHLFALDFQDLLLHPIDRRDEVQYADLNGARWLYEWPGYDGDLTTLTLDREHGKIIHAPPHLDAFRRLECEGRLVTPPADQVAGWTARYHAFRTHWLSRILGLYANSKTKVFVVQVPRWPFDMPLILPIPGAPDLRDAIVPSPNVIVMDENAFTDLEKPEYFYDVLHVNKLARAEFTARFGKRLRDELGTRQIQP